ncbi:TonB-dependent receptor [Lacimicrobium alkaliphilum]|uniref:TonB-dependent receptor n=1 Tax=Lacimicrobium alkaliphilum TaxID=1526571 RepID=A0ABQ1R9R5_9ALTE|nr:TonB-dependent receptor [Lacimicrobium alkaliphilum]GGD61283.1 TonB-dependent receptor [Lacimicrobium alkaliphilum]
MLFTSNPTIRRHPLAISIALVLSGNAMAQDADTESSAKSIEVIKVTARHKVESLQETPIAISAFSGGDLEDARIDALNGIAERVPGFQMNVYNAAEPELFMRGIGSDIESAGAGAAIGVYVDGVYISRGVAAAMDLYDLASVEVLRGPQGTLYGKNVVGGAINFITRKPSLAYPEGKVELNVGNYGLLEGKGYVTGGISDNVGGKLAFSATKRDGFGENTFTGNDADTMDRYNLRGQLLFTPSDDLEILVSADASDSDSVPPVRYISYSEGRNQPFISDDPRNAKNEFDGFEKAKVKGVSAKVDYQLANATLTSITAYRDNDFSFFENAAAGLVDTSVFFDPWGDPANNTVADDAEIAAMQVDDMWYQQKDEVSSQFSQEFRLAGAEGAVDWQLGAYYMRQDIERDEMVNYWFHTQWGTTTGTLYNTTANVTDSYAVFGQASYNLSEQLRITAGLRWSEDKKDFRSIASGRRFDNFDTLHQDLDGNRVEQYDVSTTESWDAWTPSLVVDYKADKDLFYYYSLSRGYKAGGFNGEGPESAEEAILAFAPEFALNHELGIKSQAFDDRLRLNAAVFYTEYTDMQNQIWVETGPNTPDDLEVRNGTGEAKGLELELTALLTDNLTLTGSYGFIDAEFTDSFEVDGEDFQGNRMRRTPEHSFNMAATYEWETDAGYWSARLDYQYQDEYFFDNSNDPLTHVDSETTLNASVQLASLDDTWSVQLWGKNLTDEQNIASTTVYAAWDNTVFSSYKAPRTFGVSVTYQF